MIKHSQNAQSIKSATYLQYIRKDVRDGIHFLHRDKYQSFLKVRIIALMEVAGHAISAQSTYIEIKNIKILYGCPFMFFKKKNRNLFERKNKDRKILAKHFPQKSHFVKGNSSRLKGLQGCK